MFVWVGKLVCEDRFDIILGEKFRDVFLLGRVESYGVCRRAVTELDITSHGMLVGCDVHVLEHVCLRVVGVEEECEDMFIFLILADHDILVVHIMNVVGS